MNTATLITLGINHQGSSIKDILARFNLCVSLNERNALLGHKVDFVIVSSTSAKDNTFVLAKWRQVLSITKW